MGIYATNRYRRRRRGLSGLGDITGTINTAINVVDDPFLPELVCRIDQLTRIEHGQDPGLCANTPDGTVGGVGIGPLMPALRTYVFFQENKWAYAVAIAAILGVPFLIGYEYGKAPP